MPSTRRAFLGLACSSLAVAGWDVPRVALAAQGGLEQFGDSAPPCAPDQKVTPAVPVDATFRRGSPARTSLVDAATTGTRLTLSGTVAGIRCGRIGNAEIDFWQADERGRYDATGFRLRGHQRTRPDGGYQLMTIVPGAAPGHAPHIGIRVQVLDKREFFTAAFFPNNAGNARDPQFRPELVATLRLGSGQGQSATFDVFLDM